MELIDVLDAHGALTGIRKSKRDVHRDGDWHRASHVWIASGDRVLLQRRALAKESWPGLWDISVAGHIAAGETAMEAAVRETHEEIGLAITPADLQHLGTLRYQCALRDGYTENEFHEVYLLRRSIEIASLTLEASEVAEVRWVPVHELAQYELVPHEEEYALLRAALRSAGVSAG